MRDHMRVELASFALTMAIQQQRPGLATMLVSIPTLFDVLAVIAFAISVFLHGF
jgi:hypothetical protein